ncbi:MAG TPA: hypothetical protein VGC18_04315 [Lacisediminihabitans sp.]|uniref:hypothetical protein n=1 Tax=Lacisediminihabitans sp. TaxID=2787631 RepID=UPI002EDA6DEB
MADDVDDRHENIQPKPDSEREPAEDEVSETPPEHPDDVSFEQAAEEQEHPGYLRRSKRTDS